MSKDKSTNSISARDNGWDALIAEAKKKIERLKKSVRFFQEQKARGVPCGR